MSDLKAAFRAAKEQRATTAPTPAQIRAMKAAKLQQKQAPPQGKPSQPPPQQQQPAAAVPSAPAAEPPRVLMPPPEKKPPGPAKPGLPGVGPPAPVPEGFFSDKTADAKIRGVKLPDKQDKEAEFEAFQRSIEQDLQVAATEEAQEAEVQADEKEEFEDFAQWVRIQRIEELRQRKRAAAALEQGGVQGLDAGGAQGTEGGAAEDVGQDAASVTAEMLGLATSMPDGLGGITLPKRRRLQDTLAELQAHSSSEGDSDADDGDADLGPLLDWRAKGV